jgi:hypothetical protein
MREVHAMARFAREPSLNRFSSLMESSCSVGVALVLMQALSLEALAEDQATGATAS